MRTSNFREALVRYIAREANPPDKFSHQARLYRLATTLAEGRPFDDDVLFAAAWLHDLGVFIGHRPEDVRDLAHWDHVGYALREAPGLLQRFGFPASKIPAVLEVIRTHLPTTEPTCFEGTLLRDADILEQLGAIGLLRTISKVGRDTRFARFGDALRTLQRNLEELPGKLRLERSRRMAEPRLSLVRVFLDAAEQEAGGIDW